MNQMSPGVGILHRLSLAKVGLPPVICTEDPRKCPACHQVMFQMFRTFCTLNWELCTSVRDLPAYVCF